MEQFDYEKQKLGESTMNYKLPSIQGVLVEMLNGVIERAYVGRVGVASRVASTAAFENLILVGY